MQYYAQQGYMWNGTGWVYNPQWAAQAQGYAQAGYGQHPQQQYTAATAGQPGAAAAQMQAVPQAARPAKPAEARKTFKLKITDTDGSEVVAPEKPAEEKKPKEEKPPSKKLLVVTPRASDDKKEEKDMLFGDPGLDSKQPAPAKKKAAAPAPTPAPAPAKVSTQSYACRCLCCSRVAAGGWAEATW